MNEIWFDSTIKVGVKWRQASGDSSFQMRNSSESEVTLVTLEHAECQKVLESSKTQNYISKITGEQKIFDKL